MTMQSRVLIAVLVGVVVACCVITAVSAAEKASTFKNCQACVANGYGWCPRRRRCGFFSNRVCSGSSTDLGDADVRELTADTLSTFAYSPNATNFVLLYSAKARTNQRKAFDDAVAEVVKKGIQHAGFAAVNVDKHKLLQQRYKVHRARLPAVLAFHRATNQAHQEHVQRLQEQAPEGADMERYLLQQLDRSYWQHITRLPMRYSPKRPTPGGIVHFMHDQLHRASSRVAELDALVPRFMAAVTKASAENATAIMGEAATVVNAMIEEGVAAAEVAKQEWLAAHNASDELAGSSQVAVEQQAHDEAAAAAAARKASYEKAVNARREAHRKLGLLADDVDDETGEEQVPEDPVQQVAVDAVGGVAATEGTAEKAAADEINESASDADVAAGDGDDAEPALNKDGLGQLAAVQRAALLEKCRVSSPVYVAVMKKALEQGVNSIVRELNSIKMLAEPTASQNRRREVLEVFISELF